MHFVAASLQLPLYGEKAGFEFLGYHVRQHPVGQYVAKRGYKTLIVPSDKKVKRHLAHLKEVIQAHRGATQQELIGRLNPIIRGWCQYYRSVASSKTFAKLSSHLFHLLLNWAKHRHPNLNSHQTVSRYWPVNVGGKWVFKDKDGLTLHLHRQTHFHRHIKVQANRSPYDGDWAYWGSRLGTYPGLSPLTSFLLRQQEGKCSYCGLTFLSHELIEIHHRDGNHENHHRHNLALLHRHCHDQVHTAALSMTTGTRDNEPS